MGGKMSYYNNRKYWIYRGCFEEFPDYIEVCDNRNSKVMAKMSIGDIVFCSEIMFCWQKGR